MLIKKTFASTKIYYKKYFLITKLRSRAILYVSVIFILLFILTDLYHAAVPVYLITNSQRDINIIIYIYNTCMYASIAIVWSLELGLLPLGIL